MEFKYAFLERMHKELSEAKNKGLFDEKYFTEKEWTDINRLVDDMVWKRSRTGEGIEKERKQGEKTSEKNR